jgi:hypothetical protein
MTEWRLQQHDIVVPVPNTEENNILLHQRTRTGSSSSTSSSSFSFFGDGDTVNEYDNRCTGTMSDYRHSKRLRGIDPCPECMKSLDELSMNLRASKTVKPQQYEGFCPRHGIIIDKGNMVIRDHDQATDELACYCPDDSCATTFDNAVKKVSEELNIAENTLKFWVMFNFFVTCLSVLFFFFSYISCNYVTHSLGEKLPRH